MIIVTSLFILKFTVSCYWVTMWASMVMSLSACSLIYSAWVPAWACVCSERHWEQGPWSLPCYKTALTHAGVPSAALLGPSAESFHACAAAALQQKCFSLCHMTCSNQIQQRGCVGWNGPRRVFFCSLHPAVNLLMALNAINETYYRRDSVICLCNMKIIWIKHYYYLLRRWK